MDPKQIVAILVIGLIAGWLASLVVGGGSLVKYIIWGVLGAVVGGIVLPMVGIRVDLGNPLLSAIVVSTIGAIILVVVARVIG